MWHDKKHQYHINKLRHIIKQLARTGAPESAIAQARVCLDVILREYSGLIIEKLESKVNRKKELESIMCWKSNGILPEYTVTQPRSFLSYQLTGSENAVDGYIDIADIVHCEASVEGCVIYLRGSNASVGISNSLKDIMGLILGQHVGDRK